LFWAIHLDIELLLKRAWGNGKARALNQTGAIGARITVSLPIVFPELSSARLAWRESASLPIVIFRS
jgi:hypothetical protein